MKSYTDVRSNRHLERYFVYAFLIGCLLASQIFLPVLGKREVYPVFNWSLFSDCHPYITVPEIEVVWDSGKRLTNKQIHGRRWFNIFYPLKRFLNAETADLSEEFLNKALTGLKEISPGEPFEYKVYKSRVHIIEYVQSKNLKKDALFSQGRFGK